MAKYDVVVIGSGSAAPGVSMRCRKAGKQAADTSSWYSSRRMAERFSGFKVLVEDLSNRVLAAHLLGPDAGETINLFALAIRKGLTSADLQDMLFAYPTSGSYVVYMV